MEVVDIRLLRRALCEPIALSGALVGVLNAAAVFGALHLTYQQLGVLNVALASVLGFLARLLVSPVRRHRGQHRKPLGLGRPAGNE